MENKGRSPSCERHEAGRTSHPSPLFCDARTPDGHVRCKLFLLAGFLRELHRQSSVYHYCCHDAVSSRVTGSTLLPSQDQRHRQYNKRTSRGPYTDPTDAFVLPPTAICDRGAEPGSTCPSSTTASVAAGRAPRNGGLAFPPGTRSQILLSNPRDHRRPNWNLLDPTDAHRYPRSKLGACRVGDPPQIMVRPPALCISSTTCIRGTPPSEF